MRAITSSANPLVRQAGLLARSSRERRRAGATVIEGVHLCQAWLARHGMPRAALFARAVVEPAPADRETAVIARACADVGAIVDDALYASISQLEDPPGVAFVIDLPRPALPGRVTADCVYLDGVQDPGNVGSILRTCAAFGVGIVAMAPGTAQAWSPKVLRAGMGAHFALAIHEGVGWQEWAPRLDVAVRATRMREAVAIDAGDVSAPACWVFGSEGSGVTLVAPEMAWFSVEQSSQVESLNVAAAAAICLHEQQRQRRTR